MAQKKAKSWLTTVAGILLAVAGVVKAYDIPTGKVGKASGADLAAAAGAIMLGGAAADNRVKKDKEQ